MLDSYIDKWNRWNGFAIASYNFQIFPSKSGWPIIIALKDKTINENQKKNKRKARTKPNGNAFAWFNSITHIQTAQ